MAKVAVVSSLYGEYDIPRVPPEQDIDVDWIMVTDRPDAAPGPWKLIIENRPRVPARLASRVAKCHPENYTDAEVIIWKDANLRVRSSEFASWCLEILGDSSLCQAQQLMRKDVYDELRASRNECKWNSDPLEEEVDFMISKGYPADYGIWWCGFMVSKRGFPGFGDEWMHEMVRWSCQDQFAWSYLLWKHGVRPKSYDTDLQHEYFDLKYHPDNSR